MRTTNSSTISCAVLLASTLLLSCGGESPGDGEAARADGLPPDHPPLTATQGGDDLIAPPPPGSGTGAAGLAWEAPPDWVAEAPSSAMRRAQYRVPGAAGDAQLVIFYFGPGQGGDAMANARRWAGQFAQPDGRPLEEALATERIQVGDIPVLLVEVGGTYSGGMMTGPSQKLEDYLLLGAIAEGGDANWFFKLTGPRATVAPQRDAFRDLIESLRRGG